MVACRALLFAMSQTNSGVRSSATDGDSGPPWAAPMAYSPQLPNQRLKLTPRRPRVLNLSPARRSLSAIR